MAIQNTETIWTDWVFGLSIPAGGWLSLWGGLFGVVAAFLLSILYQNVRNRRTREAARTKISEAQESLRRGVAPYFTAENADAIDVESTGRAAKAITHAKAAFEWAIAHPQHFTFEEWTRIHLMHSTINNWIETNKRSGGFISALYRGQCEVFMLTPVARHLEPYFHGGDVR
ncbi:hypothetical protein [Qipengyuania atrilutea]|uniref:DUF4760 domain-containing protein n=1 Tax=Qipengyuania atrilutea TaxID=2744473 RepID=A0A850H6F0_9SPHN|nr:hypothetical protein [Actirhodobacter atriluteus]NVD46057.1 hypothetical protein [Actirhodobacter atriluteus]